jgi:hypothetical protein
LQLPISDTNTEDRRPASGLPTNSQFLRPIAIGFTPDTILRWYRPLVANKWDYSDRKETKQGRCSSCPSGNSNPRCDWRVEFAGDAKGVEPAFNSRADHARNSHRLHRPLRQSEVANCRRSESPLQVASFAPGTPREGRQRTPIVHALICVGSARRSQFTGLANPRRSHRPSRFQLADAARA